MSAVWTLTCLIDELSPQADLIGDHVFLNRGRLGLDDLAIKVSEYRNLEEAKYWINMIPLRDYFDELLGEWCADGMLEKHLVGKIATSICSNLTTQFPNREFSWKTLRDDDDLILQII